MNLIQKAVVNALSMLGEQADKPSGMVVIGNGKTGRSLENRIISIEKDRMKGGCPLMKAVDGHLTSPKCASCYAVALLNNYPGLRKSLTEVQSVYDIVYHAAAIHPTNKRRLSGSPVYPGDRLRVYGVTDFQPSNMATLRAMAKVYQIDIISKTLWLIRANHVHLLELARLPNVNISLSFNKDLPDWENRLKEMIAFVKANNIGKTVGMNYTFTSSYRTTGRSIIEPIRHIEGIGVYHIVSKNKDMITVALKDEKKTCGIIAENGTRITDLKKEKGSCIGCNFCRRNVLDNVLPPMMAAGE